MAKTELVVVGGGNMGEALLAGLLQGNILSHDRLVAAEPIMQRRQHLGRHLNVSTVEDVSDAPPADRYVLAVKPQKIDAALSSLAGVLPENGAMVLSIVAGVSTGYLAGQLGGRARIVRAMPNTPMLVGCGCTGICAGPGATDADMNFVKGLFAVTGEVLIVDEQAIDAVTAVSGSGPAYFFYLVEAMTIAGMAEGLDEDTAAALARQTCAGAAALLGQTGEKPAVLRAKVTSPGGTTAAAIESMDSAGVKDALVQAVRAAAARSRQLGK